MYQLTGDTMHKALSVLAEKDAMLDAVYKEFGVPPLWDRPENFATLVHIILEQKVSLNSAEAVMRRVRNCCPGMEPAKFLRVPESALRKAGVSASKVSYCVSIATSIESGALCLSGLRALEDNVVIEKLTQVRGIGPWSAGVYLMMAMKRPDAWASGDRALAVSYAECAGLDDAPEYAKLDGLAQAWKPHRATAARLLWHAYLRRRNRG